MISPHRQREIEEFARELAKDLKKRVEKRFRGEVFFTVVMGTYGRDGWLTYVSSAQREGMIQSLRELAANVESDPRQNARAYVTEHPTPQRFDVERVEQALARGVQLEEVPKVDGGSLLVSANGRPAGVLVLSALEERALKARLFSESE